MAHHDDADGRDTGQTGVAPVGPLPPTPEGAAMVFGAGLPLAEHFAGILADTGVSHGLIGPREVPILWERHILNCAVVHEAFPPSAEIVDVGSGAGLPGLALAIARPDLIVHLVEPMLRRTTWLEVTISELGLENALVHRGRAEEFHGRLSTPFAAARAVARIDKLARWTFPLLANGGTLVALKGSQAAEELAAEQRVLTRLGMRESRLGSYGEAVLDVPTVTLELTIGTGARALRGPRERGTGPRARARRRT